MLKFTIREIMVATLAIAMGVAWFAEHRRLNAALSDVKKAEYQATLAQAQEKKAAESAAATEARMRQALESLTKQVAPHGLEIDWKCEFPSSMPIVSERQSGSPNAN